MLVGGVVEHQFGDHAESAAMRLAQESLENRAACRRPDGLGVIGDVVAVVAPGRRIERQQPDGRDAQILQIIELLGEAAKIAHAVVVAVEEGADVHFINDRVLVPKRIGIRDES